MPSLPARTRSEMPRHLCICSSLEKTGEVGCGVVNKVLTGLLTTGVKTGTEFLRMVFFEAKLLVGVRGFEPPTT